MIKRFSLCLSAEGDRFSCRALENPLQDYNDDPTSFHLWKIYKSRENHDNKYLLESGENATENIPASIKKALDCSSRSQVLAYIQDYVKPAVIIRYEDQFTQDKEYYKLEGTEEVDLYHSHFDERHTTLRHHWGFFKGRAHKETPDQLYDFVTNRESFFSENHSSGYKYRNKSLLDLSWIKTFMYYVITTISNKISHTCIGLILGMRYTHFCEDFDKGYYQAMYEKAITSSPAFIEAITDYDNNYQDEVVTEILEFAELASANNLSL